VREKKGTNKRMGQIGCLGYLLNNTFTNLKVPSGLPILEVELCLEVVGFGFAVRVREQFHKT
jgi:hypothetical protein